MLRHWRDAAPALLILAFAIFAFVVTFSFPEVPAAFAQGMQASAMPQLILGLIIALTVVMAFQGFGEAEPDRAPVSWKVWATKAVMIGAAFALEPLGVVITLFLVALILPLLWGERRFFVVALFAVATPSAVYLLFTKALQLRLPQGPLEGLI